MEELAKLAKRFTNQQRIEELAEHLNRMYGLASGTGAESKNWRSILAEADVPN